MTSSVEKKNESDRQVTSPEPPIPSPSPAEPQEHASVDLAQRRDQLTARVAELQWDLGGLVYEMAIRNRIRVEVLVAKAAALQDVDAELSEVERILRMEETGDRGRLRACGAPHSSGAVYCWQCGQPLLEHVPSDAISIWPVASAASRRTRGRRSAEAAGDVVARARVRRLGEDPLGVVVLDRARPGACRRSTSRLKKAVRSATRAACCMLWVTITIV